MGPPPCFRACQKLPETRRTAPNSYGNSLGFSFQIRFIGGPRFWTFRVFGLIEALKVVLGGWRPLVFEIFTSRSHRDQNQGNPSTLTHFIGRNVSGIWVLFCVPPQGHPEFWLFPTFPLVVPLQCSRRVPTRHISQVDIYRDPIQPSPAFHQVFGWTFWAQIGQNAPDLPSLSYLKLPHVNIWVRNLVKPPKVIVIHIAVYTRGHTSPWKSPQRTLGAQKHQPTLLKHVGIQRRLILWSGTVSNSCVGHSRVKFTHCDTF